MTNKNCHVSSEYKYIAQYITQYISQFNCDIYRDIDQSLIQGHAWMLKHSNMSPEDFEKKMSAGFAIRRPVARTGANYDTRN